MYGRSNRFKLLFPLFILLVLTLPLFLSCSEDKEDTSSQATPAAAETAILLDPDLD